MLLLPSHDALTVVVHKGNELVINSDHVPGGGDPGVDGPKRAGVLASDEQHRLIVGDQPGAVLDALVVVAAGVLHVAGTTGASPDWKVVALRNGQDHVVGPSPKRTARTG